MALSCSASHDKFVHPAVAAQAPLLVTGDADVLDAPEIAGLRIVVAPPRGLKLLGAVGK